MKNNERGIALITIIIIVLAIAVVCMGGVLIVLKINKTDNNNEPDKLSASAPKQTAVPTATQNLSTGNNTNKSVNNPNAQDDIYVKLYTDGTLAFSNNSNTISGKNVSKDYGSMKDMACTNNYLECFPYQKDYKDVKKVVIVDKIQPHSTAVWFSNLQNIYSIEGMENLDTSLSTSTNCMFCNCKNLQSIDVSQFDTTNVVNMYSMFNGCENLTNIDLKSFKTSNVEDIGAMFYECKNLTNIDLSKFDTTNVDNINRLFYGCTKLTNINFGIFNTENITSMQETFSGCESLTYIDLSGFNTSNVEDMSYLFADCKSLTNINLNRINTMNVVDMSNMFSGCSSLTSIDLKSLNTANVENMDGMFKNCINLTQIDLSNFDTTNLGSMAGMFQNCEKLSSLDLSSFKTDEPNINMNWIFNGCKMLSVIYVGKDWKEPQNSLFNKEMFKDCGTDHVTVK